MRRKLIALGLCVLLLVTIPFSVLASGRAGAINGRTVLRYSYWGTEDEAASTQEAIDAYNAMQDAVHVELLLIPNATYTAELQRRSVLSGLGIAADMPDCGIMHESGVLDFAANGLLADVSDMYRDADAKPMDCVTYRQEGQPVAYSTSTGTLILYYNRTLFEAAGIQAPPTDPEKAWTWEEFIDVARRLTLDAAGRHPGEEGFDADSIVQYGCSVDRWTWQMEVWAHANGGRWFSEDGKHSLIAEEAAIQSIQRVADLTLVEHVQPPADPLTANGMQDFFLQGHVAMATGGTWNIGTCLESSGIDYGIAVLPKMEKAVTIATSGPQVVFSRSPNQLAAMDFIRWYTKEENSWPMIESGIWMPLLSTYYTDDAAIDAWLRDPDFALADEYGAARSVLVDYTRECAVPTGWYYTPHTDRYHALLQEVLAPVWTGEQTAQEALEAAAEALEEAIQQDF